MLFASKLVPGIADGSVTLTFRRWKTRQAIVGHRYRTIAGMLEVDEVLTVEPGSITDVEARSAGYEDASVLVGDLRDDPSTPVIRVRFHLVDEPDPRDVLAGDDSLPNATWRPSMRSWPAWTGAATTDPGRRRRSP